MFAKRTSRFSSSGSAAVARARLMEDPTTRRNAARPDPTPPFPPASGLSAADQKRHVLHVLRSFHFFHLADLAYDPARQITTAIFRPNLDHDDVPHKVQIDARGNLLVTRIGPYHSPPRRREWQLWLLSGMTLVALFLALFTLT